MPAPKQLLWDIFEEHLDEAAFLWGEWEQALDAANYTLAEVASGPEARLLAHLDALVLGGPEVAQELLLPALAGEAPGLVAAAAWALVQAEPAAHEGGVDHQDAVIAALVAGGPPVSAAIARALRLSPRADLGRIARLWREGAPAAQAVAFDLIAAGEPAWAREQLEPVLGGADAPARASALRALRRAPDRGLAVRVEGALDTELKEVRREAMVTGVLLGVSAAWDTCRRVALSAGDGCRLPLALLAGSERPPDRQMVVSMARDAKVKRHAIWALGFAGDLAAADTLVDATADQEVARAAGESLSAITGVAIAGALAAPPASVPDDARVGDDDPAPALLPEDGLPLPDAAAVKKWWQGARARFAAGARFLGGQPRTPVALRAALATAPMWRRELLALELAAATSAAPAVDVKIWARDQARALGVG